MMINELIDTFDEIEKTTSRIEKTEHLTKLFKKVKEADDMKVLIKMCQGELISTISGEDKLGVAEITVINALTLISGFSRDKIRESVLKHGDIGSAAEEVLKGRRQKTLFVDESQLNIVALYNLTRKLGEYGGKTKIDHLRKILSLLTPKQAKYIVKMIVGLLRLGISTQTIIVALSYMATDKPDSASFIEKAYNMNPDLSVIAVQVMENGVMEIDEIVPMYYTPIKPMLASRLDYNDIFPKMGGNIYVEPKLDGERVQIHKNKIGENKSKITLYSRQLTDITDQYPDLVEIIDKGIAANDCILDGEIVAMEGDKFLPFQVLMKRKRKHDVEESAKEVPVTVWIFDVIKLGDKDYTNTPYIMRKEILIDIFQETDKLRHVNYREVRSPAELVEYFNEARGLNMEGIICKSAYSQYQAGKRGNSWVKLKSLDGAKMADTIDVIVIGGYNGRGRRAQAGIAGSLLCAIYDEQNSRYIAFTNLGTGFTDEIMEELTMKVRDKVIPHAPHNVFSYIKPDVWVEPFLVLEIMADEIQYREGKAYTPRFPVFKSIRTDKGPKDVTTLTEIKEMYERQRQAQK